jgi:hypothetical protein
MSKVFQLNKAICFLESLNFQLNIWSTYSEKTRLKIQQKQMSSKAATGFLLFDSSALKMEAVC